jgi:Ser/Thr protein kinase RdoA (MazF antagonist)
MLDAVENATGRRMTGLARPLPSYINRVYEIEDNDGEKLIAKFYRPGRWSPEALQDEHDFVLACHADEIPVIAPLCFKDGKTLHEDNGIFFTIFPKRFGRQFEATSPQDWIRIGRLLGRVHVVGAREDAEHRPGEGVMIIDFDDMMVGPPVQDLWMLLPDQADKCRREFGLILQGYEQFREFDDHTFRLVEPLRAMRIIYFLAWCSRQINDYTFRSLYPEWGSDAFWQREISDLTRQRNIIREHL